MPILYLKGPEPKPGPGNRGYGTLLQPAAPTKKSFLAGPGTPSAPLRAGHAMPCPKPAQTAHE